MSTNTYAQHHSHDRGSGQPTGCWYDLRARSAGLLVQRLPHIRSELHHWRRRARTIPDPQLRQTALFVQITKRGNIDGAAAFAVFARRARRLAVIRAQVAFQAIYDYVDTLAEQAHDAPIVNGHQLHHALLIALDPAASQLDYYAHCQHGEDAGYLALIVNACRAALGTLPSHPAVSRSADRLAKRIVIYQSLNLTDEQGGPAALARWASRETPPDTGLQWWETAASAGSSLGVFALIAMASRPGIEAREAQAVENTYFPWVGSLHSLLDSLIDLPEDVATHQHNLVTHYRSSSDTATSLCLLATASMRRTSGLPDAAQHCVILAGMTGYYLSEPGASLPHAQQTKTAILDVVGNLAIPVKVFSISAAWLARGPRGRAKGQATTTTR